MTCKCKTEIDEKLLERFKAEAPEATEHGASLQGYGFALVGNKMLQLPYMEVKQTARHPLKNGGTKVKTKKLSMFFSYCPFCGEKINKGAV